MVKISVIMPVYNSEEYLEKAIDSVLGQSLQEIELLLMDDGSTDSSGRICDEKAEKDNRVKVYHQKNAGQCAARNKALQLCEGEYITFIDNDDIFLDRVLESNYELAKKYDADIVKFGFIVEDIEKNYTEIRERHIEELLVINEENRTSEFPKIRNSGYFSSVWNGIYKKSFLVAQQMSFNEKIRFGFEDCIYNIECYGRAAIQVINPQMGYLYYQRYNHSTFKKFDISRLDAWKIMVEKEFELYKMLYKNEDVMWEHWNRQASTYLQEFLFMISEQKSTMSLQEKKMWLKRLHQMKEYSRIKDTTLVSKQKKLSLELFDKEKYNVLLGISKLYSGYVVLKKMRSSKKRGNR